MNIKLNNNLSANGTSLKGYISLNPKKLLEAYPNFMEGDECKITKEWTFEVNGKPITLYDWKCTNLYDDDLPSPDNFWCQGSVDLNIGGGQGSIVEVAELQEHLKQFK